MNLGGPATPDTPPPDPEPTKVRRGVRRRVDQVLLRVATALTDGVRNIRDSARRSLPPTEYRERTRDEESGRELIQRCERFGAAPGSSLAQVRELIAKKPDLIHALLESKGTSGEVRVVCCVRRDYDTVPELIELFGEDHPIAEVLQRDEFKRYLVPPIRVNGHLPRAERIKPFIIGSGADTVAVYVVLNQMGSFRRWPYFSFPSRELEPERTHQVQQLT